MLKGYDLEDTIVAIATPPGRGAIGIVRLSGKQAIAIAQKITRQPEKRFQKGHRLFNASFYNEQGQCIDEGLVAVFKAPKSYTKEDVIEFHCHGNPRILEQVVRTAIHYGARLAQPGEFTFRAFYYGAMDLTQAEGVAELIAANNPKSQQLALQQLKGEIKTQLQQLRQQLLHFTALIELELDFADEDVEFAERTTLLNTVNELEKEIHRLLKGFQAGNTIKEGIRITIIGKPNAGKSTLLNQLLSEQKAIVSDIPGTTRDIIEDAFYLEGFLFRIADTAGLRQSEDPIEQEGIRRSLNALSQSHIALVIYDLTTDNFQNIRHLLKSLNVSLPPYTIYLANKIDQCSNIDFLPTEVIPISAKEGKGLSKLYEHLRTIANELTSDALPLTSLRHYQALNRALKAIQEVKKGLQEQRSGEMLSLDLRVVLDAIGEITGEITTEDILSEIFSNFCIGK